MMQNGKEMECCVTFSKSPPSLGLSVFASEIKYLD